MITTAGTATTPESLKPSTLALFSKADHFFNVLKSSFKMLFSPNIHKYMVNNSGGWLKLKWSHTSFTVWRPFS